LATPPPRKELALAQLRAKTKFRVSLAAVSHLKSAPSSKSVFHVGRRFIIQNEKYFFFDPDI